MQEGSRYNALHVAAKAKNAKITRLILDSITRLDFIGYLYDDNDIDSCISRSEILLDRYLNTPDKGANETPLHLAVKHGAVEVVQVLLSYSQCQKNNVFNRYKKLPRDVSYLNFKTSELWMSYMFQYKFIMHLSISLFLHLSFLFCR